MSETAPFPNPTPVRVRTTRPVLPLPPSASRASAQTERLAVRPFAASDLEALHALLREPAGAAQSSTGRAPAGPDPTTETRARLADYVRGAATYQCAAVLRETGELVGAGGIRGSGDGDGDGDDKLKLKLFFGWPEVGYGVAGAQWGRGLATEFLAAWTALYFGPDVPREEVEDAVAAAAGDGGGDGEGGVRTVAERVTAMVEAGNVASRRVLEKNGARPFVQWSMRDPREGFGGREVDLVGYVLERPRPVNV